MMFHLLSRNAVERAFGILKARFPILTKMSSYSFERQVKIVKSCFMIHNFIKLNQGYEDEFDDWYDDNVCDDDDNNLQLGDDDNDAQGADDLRDQIAYDMWVQYQEYLANNR